MNIHFSFLWGGVTANITVGDDLVEQILRRRAQRLPEWISVAESLPEVGYPVLVKLPGTPHALIATRQGANTWRFVDRVSDAVTHWRSLPELPQ